MDNIHVNLAKYHTQETYTDEKYIQYSCIGVIYLDMLEHTQEQDHTSSLFVERPFHVKVI